MLRLWYHPQRLKVLLFAGAEGGAGGLEFQQLKKRVKSKKIRHGIIDEVDEKVKRLKYDSRKSVRTALVYDGRLVASVPADRYFDFLLPAEKLLGNCQI